MDYFLVASGGTGMRSLESFVHLCAMGMFPNNTYHILQLDTDLQNGNLLHTRDLIELYNQISGDTAKGAGYFSANIKLYDFSPKGTANKNFRQVCGITAAANKEIVHQNDSLAKLFFSKEVQEFSLKDGYRAQTQVGSYLMYNALISEANNPTKGLYKFLEAIKAAYANSGSPVRLFVLGSLFGGTGASSLPILPRALEEGLKASPAQVKYGSVLFTKYFYFEDPKDDQLVAKAGNFPTNVQAALKFYNTNKTVKETYERLYLVGWPPNLQLQIDPSKTFTGGKDQQNPAHAIELIGAAAAHDFFQSPLNKTDDKVFARSVETVHNEKNEATGVNLSFKDFFSGEEDSKRFQEHLGCFYALNHLTEQTDGFNALHQCMQEQPKLNPLIQQCPLRDDHANLLDRYFNAFGFKIKDDSLQKGWLHQIADSTHRNNQPGFLLNPDVYRLEPASLKKFNWGDLYQEKSHKAKVRGGFFGVGKPNSKKAFDAFIEKALDTALPNESQKSPVAFVDYLHAVLSNFYKFA